MATEARTPTLKEMKHWQRSFSAWSQSRFGLYTPQYFDYEANQWVEKVSPVVWPDFWVRVFDWAWTLDADGFLPVHTFWDIDVAQSGKTLRGAGLAEWFGIFHGKKSAVQIGSNSKEQSEVRVYDALTFSIENNPWASSVGKVEKEKIAFRDSGNVARALPQMATTTAGASAVFTEIDEPWGITGTAGRNYFGEMKRTAARRISVRYFSSYTPYEDDDSPMNDVLDIAFEADEESPREGWERVSGLEDLPLVVKDGYAIWWNHDALRYPWYSPGFLDEQRNDPTLSESHYLRHYETRRPTKEDALIPLAQWDAMEDPSLHPVTEPDKKLAICAGVDIGTKFDNSAGTARSLDVVTGKMILRQDKVLQPAEFRNAEKDIVTVMKDWIYYLHKNFNLLACGYDESQFFQAASELRRLGVNMVQITQNNGRVLADTMYRNLIRAGMLSHYAEATVLRTHISHAVATEQGNGTIRLSKRGSKYKNDAAVADSMTCFTVNEYRQRFMTLARQGTWGDRVVATVTDPFQQIFFGSRQ